MIIGPAMAQRAILPIGRNRSVEQARVVRRQRRVAQSEPVRHPRTKILDKDIGPGDEVRDNSNPARLFEIHR